MIYVVCSISEFSEALRDFVGHGHIACASLHIPIIHLADLSSIFQKVSTAPLLAYFLRWMCECDSAAA
jgi:hypothetical protein